MNKVILIGRLGKDPEASFTPNTGMAITKFSMATDNIGPGGAKTADWHQIICFGQLAENCAKYLRKGKRCSVDGRISYQSRKSPDGVQHNFTNIIADRVEFLDPAEKSQPKVKTAEQEYLESQGAQAPAEEIVEEMADASIPF